MIQRKHFRKLIILLFMGLIGFCLANSIKAQSAMGFVLALTGLGAAIYFLYILAKAAREQEETA